MAVIGEIATIVSDSKGCRITLHPENSALDIDSSLTETEEAVLLTIYTEFFNRHFKEEIEKRKRELDNYMQGVR
nr:MAG TPA: hypothetical protein [Caudoviricetes sp.]